jgi:aldose 1-epimerase
MAQQTQKEKVSMKIEKSAYGKTEDGKAVDLYTLTNENGNQIQMINYGAIIVSISVPDRNNNRTNVTLGFDKLEGYLARHPYFGATVGRFCNRIAKGKFSIDGKEYTLATNNGPNHLHGGVVGFDKLMWQVEELDAAKVESLKLTNAKGVGLRFKVRSPDGQEGYPGNLDVVADYIWDNNNCITNTFTATTDKPTVLNLTNHAYYNLGGWKGGEIVDHELKVAAKNYLGVDDRLIPTGEMVPVAGTPLDFVQAHKIGERIAKLTETNGYDHCYVVDGQPGTLRECATVVDPKSGRALEIRTTQPGVQFYTGNFLDGSEGNGGFKFHEAFCLETQHFPDSPNQPKFPTTLLKPGQTFKETTTLRFYTVK